MRKWWWWWLPGFHKDWKLEKRRIEALSEITGERLQVELMAQRPRRTDDPLNNTLLENVLQRLNGIEQSARQAAHTDALEDLTDDAELQGIFRAFLCPATAIQDEGSLAIDLIEVWGVPKAETKKLHDLFDKKLQNANADPQAGRGALYLLFAEEGSWGDYIDDYEDTMRSHTGWFLLPL